MNRALKTFLSRTAAVAVGLAAAGVVAAVFGGGPGVFFAALAEGAFGGWGRLTATLVKVAPLLLAGLAVAVPLKAGLFNIGAEGQMYVGALAAVAVALCAPALPAWALVPTVIASGAAAGALWGALAGVLKGRWGVHEVVATIMLNFIALHATAWLVTTGPLADPRGLARTPEVPQAARLPVVFESGIHGLSAAFFIALAAAVVAWWFISRTVTGYRLRAAGGNPLAASRHGIRSARMTLTAMAAGGAFAGLAGALEVAGVQYSVSAAFSPGYGFDGIAVALVAGGNCLAVPAAALLFAALRAAGTALQLDAGLSPQLIYVIEAVIVIAVAIPALPRSVRRFVRRAGPRPASREAA